MKKFLSAILSFAMIFALSIPAFAADITVAPTETVTNEYQSMLELQKISNATLAAEGYTPSEIETIRNTDQIFDDHIALLNTLSDNSLQTAGYTVDQIRGIRNYDPDSATVNEKVALSSVPFFYSHFFSIAFFSSRISFTIISTAPTIRPASTIIPA